MGKFFNGVKLRSWGGTIVETAIDIPKEQVIAVVKYSNHGDEFLLVKTEDACYEYGWFCDRNEYPEYSDLESYNNIFYKKPELYYDEDTHSSASNAICFALDKILDRCGFGSPIICRSEESANFAYDTYIYRVKDVYDQGKTVWGYHYGHTYHCDYTQEVLKFLKANNILTEENLAKLEILKKYWRIGEVDGKAGVVKWESDYAIDTDRIDFVWHRGNFISRKKYKTKRKTYWDEFGDDRRLILKMKQFT